jgi:hypothetical protein
VVITLYRELAADRTGACRTTQLNLAACYFDASQYPDAAKYDRLIAEFPQPLVPLAQLNAGYSYYQIGEFRKRFRNSIWLRRTKSRRSPDTGRSESQIAQPV